MNGAEELNDRFYTGFILMLCGVCVFFTLFVLIVIFGKKIKVKWNKVIFFGLLALSVCATALFAVRFSRYCLDFGTVRKGEYRTMTGTVTGYGKAISFENGSVFMCRGYGTRRRGKSWNCMYRERKRERNIPFSICRIRDLP